MPSDKVASNHIDGLEQFQEDSRIWIYQTNRTLTDQEVEFSKKHLDVFAEQWTSHNKSLLARGLVLYNRFLVIVLDERASSSASGCSIDSQVHFIKKLGEHLQIDFMNRDLFIFMRGEDLKVVPMHSLNEEVKNGSITMNDLVFDNLVKSLGQLKERWLVPLEESWHSRFVN